VVQIFVILGCDVMSLDTRRQTFRDRYVGTTGGCQLSNDVTSHPKRTVTSNYKFLVLGRNGNPRNLFLIN
jgi:hypothetical protein